MSIADRRRPGKKEPFADSAQGYLRLGWSPLPVDGKSPLVRGYHGRNGKYPDLVTVEKWARSQRFRNANVAWRLPGYVIGIDVDAYDGKPGARTLWGLERDLGSLPETWITTSRCDGVSGIGLYRIPEGLSWNGTAGPGIDIIHSGNRYVVVPPSVHRTGRQYRWNRPMSPILEDLPWLPEAWTEFLAASAENIPDGRKGISRGTFQLRSLRASLLKHGKGEPCPQLQGIAGRAVAEIQAGASAHDTALAAVWGIVADWKIGHVGALAALSEVRQAFDSAPGPRQRARTDASEWQSLFRGLPPPGDFAAPPDPCRALKRAPAVTGLTPERIARLKNRRTRNAR